MNNEKCPNLGSVLQSVNEMKKFIQVASPKPFVQLHEIIDDISANSMDEPLFSAGMYYICICLFIVLENFKF